jgi:hypothetical protein
MSVRLVYQTHFQSEGINTASDLPGLRMSTLCPRNTTAGTPTQVPDVQKERGNVNRKISRHPLNERMSVQACEQVRRCWHRNARMLLRQVA